MPRKGENIYKRKDGRWEGRYIKEYSISGKACWGYVYGRTYRQVKDKLREQFAEGAKKEERRETGITYAAILNTWLQSKEHLVKESTFARYYALVNQHIIPFLGEYPVERIGVKVIEDYAAHLLTNGRLDGTGGLSPKMTNDILSIVKCSFSYAQDHGYSVHCNPFKVRVRQSPREMRVLTVSEQRALQSFLLENTDLCKFGVLLSLFTGIRIGELCALRWQAIDIDSGTLEVRETLQRVKNAASQPGTHIIIGPPKSSCSIRKIPLPAFLLNLSRKLISRPDAYVLTGKEGSFMEPRVLQNKFKGYLRKCSIEDANYHSLRHTFATRCVEIGFDIKSLSEILGHANVNITLNRYVHSSFQLKAENMNKLAPETLDSPS